MSKKTKKQKQIADQRRSLLFSKPIEKILGRETKSTELEEHKTNYQMPSIHIYPLQEVRKDLTKTILLCILAISLEVALYLILEKQLILPFK